MLRMILLAAFVAILAIGFLAVLGALRALAGSPAEKDPDPMPAPFRRISYILLVILMFGVAAGWLGAA
jgi:cell division protein FtsX